MLLVGDSVAMVVHGHDTTLPITMDEMLAHCKAVARGASRAFCVGDMPFGSGEREERREQAWSCSRCPERVPPPAAPLRVPPSRAPLPVERRLHRASPLPLPLPSPPPTPPPAVEVSPEHAVRSAIRMMKEGSMDAVKIEGGFANRVKAVRAVVEAGVAVMGHVGLTPQAISVLGGFRPAAQSAGEALRVIKEAKALEAAGCFGLVLECVPELVAAAVTRELNIPTIGIGAGGATSGQARSLRAAAPWFVSPVGCHLPRASPSPPHPPHAQVLVYHDLLGMMQHPHHAKVTPKFCKQYASGARRVFPGSPRVPALSAQRARPPCSPAPHPSPRCACPLPAPPPPPRSGLGHPGGAGGVPCRGGVQSLPLGPVLALPHPA